MMLTLFTYTIHIVHAKIFTKFIRQNEFECKLFAIFSADARSHLPLQTLVKYLYQAIAKQKYKPNQK